MNAERVTIESDEHGFELHVLDEEGDWHIFNIHGIAEEVYDHVKASIGPWLQERDAARASMPPMMSEPWPGESPFDYYERTGDDEPLRNAADQANKAAKENH